MLQHELIPLDELMHSYSSIVERMLQKLDPSAHFEIHIGIPFDEMPATSPTETAHISIWSSHLEEILPGMLDPKIPTYSAAVSQKQGAYEVKQEIHVGREYGLEDQLRFVKGEAQLAQDAKQFARRIRDGFSLHSDPVNEINNIIRVPKATIPRTPRLIHLYEPGHNFAYNGSILQLPTESVDANLRHSTIVHNIQVLYRTALLSVSERLPLQRTG